MAKAKQGQIEEMRIETVTLGLVGDSPLMLHKFSAKAARQMLGKQMGLASAGRDKRDPQTDFIRACQFAADGHMGISAIALKKCAIRGAKATSMLPMTDATSAFHIVADRNQCVPVFGTWVMDMSYVKNDNGGTDVRFRPRADEWAIFVTVRYNASLLTQAQLVQLFRNGGFGTGIGEWRVQNQGDYGRFHVATKEEVEAIRDKHEAAHRACMKQWQPLIAQVEAEADELLQLIAQDQEVAPEVNTNDPSAFKKIGDPDFKVVGERSRKSKNGKSVVGSA